MKELKTVYEGLPKLYSTSEEENPMVVKKVLSPMCDWVWYIIDGSEEEGILFGYVVGFFPEFGTISYYELSQIYAYVDDTFKPVPVKEILNKIQ